MRGNNGLYNGNVYVGKTASRLYIEMGLNYQAATTFRIKSKFKGFFLPTKSVT